MKYLGLLFLLMTTVVSAQTLRVATFNVSMEATNYQQKGQALDSQKLSKLLQNGQHQQIKTGKEEIP